MFSEKHARYFIVTGKVDYLAVSTNSVCSTAYFWFPAPWLQINISGVAAAQLQQTPLDSEGP